MTLENEIQDLEGRLSLIVNGVDANIEEIQSYEQGKGKIHIATFVENNYVCVRVTDNCAGMEKARDRLMPGGLS